MGSLNPERNLLVMGVVCLHNLIVRLAYVGVYLVQLCKSRPVKAGCAYIPCNPFLPVSYFLKPQNDMRVIVKLPRIQPERFCNSWVFHRIFYDPVAQKEQPVHMSVPVHYAVVIALPP